MIFESGNLPAGEVFEVNQYGKSIHVLKAAPVTRIRVYMQGSVVMDSIVWQGMSLNDIEFDKVTLVSDAPQELAIWAGKVPFDFKQVSTRQQTILGSQKFIGNGIYNLLENDPSRIIARLECDNDIWIGGQDLQVAEGVVQNGRKYKANQEFELTAYGDVKCWITDTAEQELFKNNGTVKNGVMPWQYGRTHTRSELESLNVPYFDLIVPSRMDGVPFKINVVLEYLVEQSGAPLLFYTVGDPTTEELRDYGWSSGGPFYGEVAWSGASGIALSSGAHRFFMVEQSGVDGQVDGDVANSRFNRVWTDNEVYAIGGVVQITQERA